MTNEWSDLGSAGCVSFCPQLGQIWVEGEPRSGATRLPMKRHRHSEEQIIAVLNERQARGRAEEVSRRQGIRQATYLQEEEASVWLAGGARHDASLIPGE